MTDSTRETIRIAAVLVVGGSQSLMKAVHQVIGGLRAAEVVSCAVREAPTRAAELRPFAIVMNEDVYEFDSVEFDALARDVGAQLITAASGARGAIRSTDELATSITRAFEHRRGRRRARRP